MTIKQKLQEEKRELDTKIKSLSDFLPKIDQSSSYWKQQYELLSAQAVYMNYYSQVLGKRIALIK